MKGAQCQIMTSLSGMRCPMCKAELQPWVEHTCVEKEPEPPNKPRKKRAGLK